MLTTLRLALTVVRGVAAQTLRRWAVTAGLWILAAMFLFLGLLGLALALWFWLAEVFSPVSAGLIIGGAGLLCAAVLVMIARQRSRAPSPLGSALSDLLGSVKDQDPQAAIWAPFAALALLGFLLAGKKG
jgi:hypothetical protein